MTIDEFIKELESKAELEKERAFYDAVKWNRITEYGTYCRKLESEYRQLAEWLKELKAHREAWMKVITEIKEYQKDAFYYDDVVIKRKQILEVINKYKPKEGDAECPEKKR